MRSDYGRYGSSLRDLARLRSSRRRRISSWDKSGGNGDYRLVEPETTALLAEIEGPASINHIWCTVGIAPEAMSIENMTKAESHDYLRRLLLRITWDEQADPSVLVPLGDFFGVGHARTVNFSSAPLQMSPTDGKGFNCWFHMPFARRARLELVSEMSTIPVVFYYYVDYEAFDELGAELGCFHAQWNRQNPTDGQEQGAETNFQFIAELGTNLGGDSNYVILDAEGRGHYVGCVLNLRNLRQTSQANWYGEGDDMIFIDGEAFPPSLHGTGTEDYFNTAFCPAETYNAPYHGITLAGGPNWSGEISLYRFHIEDPITFDRSIRVTIEHGHANKRSDDLSSVAYWYQALPHKPFAILPVAQRLPFPLDAPRRGK
jgi:hypothetical protein